jgi:ribonuclease HII
VELVGGKTQGRVTSGRASLAELRREAAAQHDAAALGRLRRRLRGDPRAGVDALRASLAKRIAAARSEQRRIDGLFALRADYFARGLHRVAGIDEVGVGPLAGPVVAAAVILPDEVDLPGLDDSKKLSRASRERLDRAIREQALAVGISEVEPREIDRVNILQATLLAMRRAVEALGGHVDHLLVDARTIPGVDTPQTALIGGDGRDGSIAAASIVAKVHRDALMRRLDEDHPGYGFVRHMGYGTVEHLAALRRLGASAIHRHSFRPVRGAGCDGR